MLKYAKIRQKYAKIRQKYAKIAKIRQKYTKNTPKYRKIPQNTLKTSVLRWGTPAELAQSLEGFVLSSQQ